MPVYEYKCTKCGQIFDAFQQVGGDGSDLNCPVCGESKPEKIFSSFASSGFNLSSNYIGGCGSGGGGFT